jgi:hypothetical protein
MLVVSCPQRAEHALRSGQMPCPRCTGRLRPHGHGRARTVRGLGSELVTVTPRRARCADCQATHILLPAALSVRRADTTEVIGTALLLKVHGAGFRTIADRIGRPASTVRRWLRRVPDDHARWLHQQAVQFAFTIDKELLALPPRIPQPSPLEQALDLLAGAALRYRQRLGLTFPAWTLIGMFSQGRLLAPPLIT